MIKISGSWKLGWAAAATIALSAAPVAMVTASPVGTGFTYQGQLERSGSPANTTCTYQFSLWDALGGGTQIGTTQTITGVQVADGLFTVILDFGPGAFTGEARWLQVAVQCTGDGGFTTLQPRQSLSPAPYAMFALGGSTGISLPYANGVASPNQTAFGITNSATTGLFYGVSGKTNSTTHEAAGVYGEGSAATGLTTGVKGWATNSPDGTGMSGKGGAVGGYFESFAPNSLSGNAGVIGIAGNTDGVKGIGGLVNAGVRGEGGFYGVFGSSTGEGLRGESPNGRGATGGHTGTSGTNAGVLGFSNSTNVNGAGVEGTCDAGLGVLGKSLTGQGVYGTSVSGRGINGYSQQGDGVVGQSDGVNKSGVAGLSNNANGYAGYFNNLAGGTAIRADGKVSVKILEILGGADLVESFDVGEASGAGPDPGTVLVIDGDRPGLLAPSCGAYDRRVAGVVSGAGGIEPGIRLGQEGVLEGETPVAMAGRVYVKCTTENGPIRPGDRLTTASTSGHAMRATDAERSDGAVIGKAMSALEDGTGLVLVLVNLQ